MFPRLLLSQSLRPTTARLLFNRTRHSTYCRSLSPVAAQNFHTSRVAHDSSFTNLLADDNPPAVQVSSISDAGIQLADGLVIPGACVFLEGKVFLWDVPESTVASKIREERWKGWGTERFQLFEVVTPRPEILLLGTGKTLVQPPPFMRDHLNGLGIQLDVMDTRNACSTYNLLAEEGRRVAAALLPFKPFKWQKATDTGAKNQPGS
ncbi:hypothetical protein M413DRAFT_449874 [Hebeloma cylindrosporum]|uniref:NADH dehydrogenase [ubiquinone] 1 alpha subcomplex assembly factor 3 n=1 Tax=Hebeloma cylindrosporum TaxID=76867 RepID=A0A0C3BEH2_HEBCY|nr:hypothetical protein M413DRAFT_449874 [Hebeloma cylindrosporum h7]